MDAKDIFERQLETKPTPQPKPTLKDAQKLMGQMAARYATLRQHHDNLARDYYEMKGIVISMRSTWWFKFLPQELKAALRAL